jgi:CHASE3 domain sensor protein
MPSLNVVKVFSLLSYSNHAMKKFILENWIILVIGVFLIVSMAMAIRNNYIIEKNHELQQQAELIHQHTQDILSKTMHGLDLGVRGFGLTKEESMLVPYREAVQTNTITFKKLDSLLGRQQYTNHEVLSEVKNEVNSYIQFSQNMVEAAKSDNMPVFIEMLKQDKGYDVWKKYSAFASPLFEHEEKLNKEARSNYQAAMRTNLIMQVSILLLAVPLLYFFIVQMRKERDARTALLKKVEENDRKLVFNSGSNNFASSEEINENSIHNVTMASKFIARMADGNYEVDWDGLNESNRELNKATLAGNLIQLRDKLKKVKQEDEKRNWINEGLAAFSEIVRANQHNMKTLADQCVSYLTRYLNAQQAGLFIVVENEKDSHLELAACYAFSRKKFVQKKINIGEGLIGQTYLEGDVVQMKRIPEGYTYITSGLGGATPAYLAIVPFKYETSIPAIIEISSFHDLEEHHLQFLKRAGEHLASAILNSQTTQKMKTLLEAAASNEQQMKQREEELRQNMEELQATQEELVRKSKAEKSPEPKMAIA